MSTDTSPDPGSEVVYRGMTRAEVMAQYNPRAAVADSAVWRAQWSSLSARARARYPGRRDVPYGPTPGQKLDVFSNKGGGPIHVFTHGGFWRFLDKDDHTLVVESLVDAGATAVLVNYDLCPVVRLPEAVEQVRRAVAWVYRNAAALGGDRDRLYVSGHSAGAHLTAMLAVDGWHERFGLPTDAIKGATLVSALFDLAPNLYLPGGEELGLDPASARAASPMFLEALPEVPLLVAVGAQETREWVRQTEEYVNLRRADGVPVELMKPADEHHYSILLSMANEMSDLGGALLAQMGLGPAAA